MPTSDLQLQRMGLKPMSQLPNRQGFAFTGVLRDGTCVKCHVVKFPSSGHCVAGAAFSDLIGWKC